MKQSDSTYGVNLTVKKVHVFYSGDIRYPFLCDVLTTEDSYFRCAVKAENLANFLLAQEGNTLYLTMIDIYKASSVMGVCSCQNFDNHAENLEIQIRQNLSDLVVMNVAQTFVFPMSFVINGASVIMQDKYYCLIADINNRYIGFETEAKNLPHIVSALYKDIVELQFFAFSDNDKLELIYFKNSNRKLLDMNQHIFNLK